MKVKELNISDIEENKRKRSTSLSNNNLNRDPKGDSKLTQIKNKIQKVINDEKNYKLTIGVSVLIGLLGLLLIYQIFNSDPSKSIDLIKLNNNYLPAENLENREDFNYSEISKPEEPRNIPSPVNGLLLTPSELEKYKDRPAVAVMINNDYRARPQANLEDADLVYETLIESGVTRLMPIYWSSIPDNVGPIRSARQYYLEWLSPYDAFYIHDGGASADPGSTDNVDAVANITKYGIRVHYGSGILWRDNALGRVAPHNEYASPQKAVQVSDNFGWDFPDDFEAWEFKKDAKFDSRGNTDYVEVDFYTALTGLNSGRYFVKWEYSKENNNYLRFTGGAPHKDMDSGNQVTAKNVVVQEVSGYETMDSKGHLVINTIGSGKATYLIDGKVIKGTWKKDKRLDRTSFFDNDGNPIEFNRGLTWIMATPEGWGTFDIIKL